MLARPPAAARMARVNVAKSVLLDPEARASYDQRQAARAAAPARRRVAPLRRRRTTVRYAPYAARRQRSGRAIESFRTRPIDPRRLAASTARRASCWSSRCR